MSEFLISPTSGLPFDDIRNLCAQLPGPNDQARKEALLRNDQLTKPQGSLGRLEDIIGWLASWQGDPHPTVKRPLVAVFAANHKVVEEGVSAFPPEVTAQMVQNLSDGGAAINQICASFDMGLKVFDLALEIPTENITTDAAMDEKTAAATIAFGMEAIAGGTDLLCIGEMGIGNTTIASAIYYALYGGKASDWCGPGSGLDEEGVARKINVVERAVALHKDHLDDPLEILRRLGGREIAAMMGAILAARFERIPVIIDGFVATSAAAILHKMSPETLDHCLAGHLSAEPAHKAVLEKIGKDPLLSLGMCLGEGTGAALAASLVKAAANIHENMASFEDAGVSEKKS